MCNLHRTDEKKSKRNNQTSLEEQCTRGEHADLSLCVNLVWNERSSANIREVEHRAPQRMLQVLLVARHTLILVLCVIQSFTQAQQLTRTEFATQCKEKKERKRKTERKKRNGRTTWNPIGSFWLTSCTQHSAPKIGSVVSSSGR